MTTGQTRRRTACHPRLSLFARDGGGVLCAAIPHRGRRLVVRVGWGPTGAAVVHVEGCISERERRAMMDLLRYYIDLYAALDEHAGLLERARVWRDVASRF